MSHCPASPQDLGLEAPTWWPGQRETIDMIVAAFLSGKKYVLAGIPTGGGKTIIASAVQKILGREEGEYASRSLALTHTIQLQEQYKRTLTDAVVITGRSNHPCELAPDHPSRLLLMPGEELTAETAMCATGDGCDDDLNVPGGCGYYAQWWDAADAPMVVMNYAYAVRILPIERFKGHEADENGKRKPIPNPFRRPLLVADECHLAEGAVISASGVKIYQSSLDALGIKMPPMYTRQIVEEGGPRSKKQVEYETTAVWMSWAGEHMPQVDAALRSANEELESAKDRAKEDDAIRVQLPKLKAAVVKLGKLVDALELLGQIQDPEAWIVRRDTSTRPGAANYVISATVQPLWGWAAAPEILFQHFQRVLLMSATPGDPEVARVQLGIPKEEFIYIERPSTFPIENRPVYYSSVVKLNYRSSDEDWQRLARAIVRIACLPAYIGRKGLVHSGSKANAERLVGLINRQLDGDRAFTHTSARGDKDRALEIFTTTELPLIFVTASFTTGLDLPYLIGWQVVAKVPYGNLGDEITARRRAFKLADGREFGQQAYLAECMNTVVQAAGRIVRSPTDSGPTFILDGNYAQLHARAYKPAFYLDAFRRVEE